MDNNLYQTPDINLSASFLSTGKVKLKTSEISADGRVYFALTPKNTCEELEKGYYNNTLMVSAREMTNRIRELKDVLFGMKRRRDGEKYYGKESF